MKLVIWTATNCGYCKPMKPIAAAAAEKHDIAFEAYDLAHVKDKFLQYGVRSVPTFTLLGEDGTEIERWTGQMTQSDLESEILNAKEKDA